MLPTFTLCPSPSALWLTPEKTRPALPGQPYVWSAPELRGAFTFAKSSRLSLPNVPRCGSILSVWMIPQPKYCVSIAAAGRLNGKCCILHSSVHTDGSYADQHWCQPTTTRSNVGVSVLPKDTVTPRRAGRELNLTSSDQRSTVNAALYVKAAVGPNTSGSSRVLSTLFKLFALNFSPTRVTFSSSTVQQRWSSRCDLWHVWKCTIVCFVLSGCRSSFRRWKKIKVTPALQRADHQTCRRRRRSK